MRRFLSERRAMHIDGQHSLLSKSFVKRGSTDDKPSHISYVHVFRLLHRAVWFPALAAYLLTYLLTARAQANAHALGAI